MLLHYWSMFGQRLVDVSLTSGLMVLLARDIISLFLAISEVILIILECALDNLLNLGNKFTEIISKNRLV